MNEKIEYLSVVSIEDCGDEDVYDIQMDTKWPSFVANEIIVHNCGMRSLLKELSQGGLLGFNDICATTALYRPGPMESGMLDMYVKFRQGIEDPEYDHPKMKPALEVTGGVFIYQEQVMQIARDLAGYTMADADKLRKIMGKKQKEEMAKQRDKFVDGCVSHSAMDKIKAGLLFDKIDKFAGYGFNLAHSVTYSIISYWCSYLKTHHPAEFFAATLTTVDDETKLQTAIFDAEKYGVFIAPPDINVSTNRFEFNFDGEGVVYLIAPFNKLKGISDKTAEAIMEARKLVGGKFKSREELLKNVKRRNCTVRHMDVLDKVGSFSMIEPGSLPFNHPDRTKDQIELMPGLVSAYVKSERYTKLRDIELAASSIIRSIRACDSCSLKDEVHCIPSAGSKIKFMVILDAPNSGEEAEGKMLRGKASEYLISSIKEAGLKKNDGYYTSLMKVKKPKDEKSFTNDQLLSCRKFIESEIAMVKPAVIVCMGGASIRHFYPDIKGSWSELCGKVVFNKEFDANIVFGINPQMCYFRDETQAMVDDVFAKVYQMVE